MSEPTLFRHLNDDEVAQFKQWAQDNYEPRTPISELWHPVVQAECEKINREHAKSEEHGNH